ncbi:hypothetical protein KBB27_03360, partial [Patescibacteria group bacterium]|nr:hypothetical protein [Patescibacteria group bacterium]
LQRYYTGEIARLPTVDLLADIEKQIGFRVKLDDVAHATLGIGKSGDGLMAVKYWRDGEIEKLKEYCLQDVRVTKDVYEHALQNQECFFFDRQGNKQRVPLTMNPPGEVARPAINLSLGL